MLLSVRQTVLVLFQLFAVYLYLGKQGLKTELCRSLHGGGRLVVVCQKVGGHTQL